MLISKFRTKAKTLYVSEKLSLDSSPVYKIQLLVREKNFALKWNKPVSDNGYEVIVLTGGTVSSRNINLAYQKNNAAREEEEKIVAEHKTETAKKSHSLFFKYGIKTVGTGGVTERWHRNHDFYAALSLCNKFD